MFPFGYTDVMSTYLIFISVFIFVLYEYLDTLSSYGHAGTSRIRTLREVA